MNNHALSIHRGESLNLSQIAALPHAEDISRKTIFGGRYYLCTERVDKDTVNLFCKKLNVFQRICRYFFGTYRNTHLSQITSSLKDLCVTLKKEPHTTPVEEKIQTLFSSRLPFESVPPTPPTTPTPITPARPLPPSDRWQEALIAQVAPLLAIDAILPGESGGTLLTGEEHINAILYQKLIQEERRDDVVIIPLHNDRLPEGITGTSFNANNRFVVMALSVNNNIHNTSIVLDREKKTYYYFDSYGNDSLPPTFIDHLRTRNIIDNSWTRANTTCTPQHDGWSCGYHAIANVIGCIQQATTASGDPKNVTHDVGMALRNQFVTPFKTFVQMHCRGNSSALINQVNKRHVKFALSTILLGRYTSYAQWERDEKAKPRGVPNLRPIEVTPDTDRHELGLLYKKLCQDLAPESLSRDTTFQKFTESFFRAHVDDPHQQKAIELLYDICEKGLWKTDKPPTEAEATRQTEEIFQMIARKLAPCPCH